MKLVLSSDGSKILHSPTLDDVSTALQQACDIVVMGAMGMPRVECNIFKNSDTWIPENQRELRVGELHDALRSVLGRVFAHTPE